MKNWLIQQAKFLFWGWLMTILVLSFLPKSKIPEISLIFSPDKLVHIIMYMALVTLMKVAYPNLKMTWVVGIAVLLGTMIEFLQPIITNRNFETYDIIANAVGAIVGIVILKFIVKQAKL